MSTTGGFSAEDRRGPHGFTDAFRSPRMKLLRMTHRRLSFSKTDPGRARTVDYRGGNRGRNWAAAAGLLGDLSSQPQHSLVMDSAVADLGCRCAVDLVDSDGGDSKMIARGSSHPGDDRLTRLVVGVGRGSSRISDREILERDAELLDVGPWSSARLAIEMTGSGKIFIFSRRIG